MKINSTSRPGLDKGFTLVELLVVISIISLLTLTILPGTLALFKSGADSQAYNVMAAMMSSARAAAIQRSTYVALHGQLAVEQRRTYSSIDNKWLWRWRQDDKAANPLYRPDSSFFRLAILVYDHNTGRWFLPADYAPQSLPGTMVMGQVSDGAIVPPAVVPPGLQFVDPLTDHFQNIADTKDHFADFTSFTILFSPLGTVSIQFNGTDIDLNANGGAYFESDTAKTKRVFISSAETIAPTTSQSTNFFWALDDLITAGAVPHTEPGVRAVTLFDYMKVESFLPGFPAVNPTKVTDYLDENGQLIPINVYTGQLFPRK
jgi:prepilin-type N-terminal cleavage/methylation domain-containing protein